MVLELIGGRARLEPETFLITGLGALAIAASVIIWTGRYVAGGSINIVLGILMVFYGEVQQGLIILISGVLGIVAPKIND